MHRPTRPPVELPAYRPPSVTSPWTWAAIILAGALVALGYLFLFLASI